MAEPGKSRVLIVDDEEAILETMTYTFEDEYEVLTASDAVKALDLLDSNAPVAVVLTDQRMPNMTGVEFLTRVYERHPSTVRIILTGFADMAAIIQAINDGHVYAYITKPWEPVQLKQVVRRAVDHHLLACENERLLQELRQANRFLEAMMDRLDTGALAVDARGVVQAANRSAQEYLGLGVDPQGRELAPILHAEGRDDVGALLLRLGSGEATYEEIELATRGGPRRLRVQADALADARGEPIGRVVLLHEISHEPLRTRFEAVLIAIRSEVGSLRPRLERAVEELQALAAELQRGAATSASRAALAERISRTITALQNWLAVDEDLARRDYPDAQILVDRMRVALSRWPSPDAVPARVRELARRVEAYYESGENRREPVL
jgi:FixJ family two-component response regulator